MIHIQPTEKVKKILGECPQRKLGDFSDPANMRQISRDLNYLPATAGGIDLLLCNQP